MTFNYNINQLLFEAIIDPQQEVSAICDILNEIRTELITAYKKHGIPKSDLYKLFNMSKKAQKYHIRVIGSIKDEKRVHAYYSSRPTPSKNKTLSSPFFGFGYLNLSKSCLNNLLTKGAYTPHLSQVIKHELIHAHQWSKIDKSKSNEKFRQFTIKTADQQKNHSKEDYHNNPHEIMAYASNFVDYMVEMFNERKKLGTLKNPSESLPHYLLRFIRTVDVNNLGKMFGTINLTPENKKLFLKYAYQYIESFTSTFENQKS